MLYMESNSAFGRIGQVFEVGFQVVGRNNAVDGTGIFVFKPDILNLVGNDLLEIVGQLIVTFFISYFGNMYFLFAELCS